MISGLTQLALLVAEQLQRSREAAYYAEQDNRRDQVVADPAAAFAGLFGPAAGVYDLGASAESQLLHHATASGVAGEQGRVGTPPA
ncbi:hypothetical protein [Aeromonas caviae]|uniref:hypothetical protein n=1 Tax=Aeromonas caviae TaxID=648 RepID=UPI0029D7AB4F|nr:hypothetical protein [Aeromonas caviae]MDX7852977.1 hypothetical protein [Aeromonas caviae]